MFLGWPGLTAVGGHITIWIMKKMNDEKKVPVSSGEEPFVRLIETVFLFIRTYYPEFNQVLENYGLNYSQYVALLTLFMHGTLAEGELARMLHLNPSTMSRMIYALEERGWVKCVRDPEDRRRVMVSFTPRGKKRIQGMMREPARVLVRLTEGLGEEEREQVYGMVDSIHRVLWMFIRARES